MKNLRLIVSFLLALFLSATSVVAQSDFPVESTFDVFFTSRRFSTGAPFTLAGTPAVSAYEDNSTTEITAGITLTADFDSRTGLNHLRIVATGANGYEAGKSYTLVITSGTVDSISVVGEVIGAFTLERSALANDAITAAKIAADAIGASEIAANAVGASELADDAITAAKVAADVGTEIGTAAWATATRSLTVLDEDSTTLDLDATIRAAVGMTAADLDTQLGDIKSDTGATLSDTSDMQPKLGTPADFGNGATVSDNLSDIWFRQGDVLDGIRGLVMNSGTVGSTGNDTTHVHLDGLGITYADDVLNDYLIWFFEGGEYHSRWIEDWDSSDELATVAALPAPLDNSWIFTILSMRRDVSGGPGGGLTLADFFDTDSGQTYGSAVAGSVVKEIADNAGGSSLSEAGIADAVWNELVADHVGAGSTGERLERLDIIASGGAGGLTNARAMLLDNLDAAVSTRASQASVDTVDDFVDDIESRIGTPSNLGSGATVSANLSDIEAQTDDIGAAGAGLTAIPSADIVKNQALLNFVFLMVDATDHITPMTGLTVAGQRSCDGSAFASVTGPITEIGSGFYKFDAAAADTNCNLATWKFSASGADTYSVQFRTRQ